MTGTDHHGHVPPLGVHLRGDGADVAVRAAYATGVELCLIDVLDAPDDAAAGGPAYRETRVPLDGPTYGVWHAHVPGVREGQRYGFRVSGPWTPREGHRHNPAKLLVDPYARGIVGAFDHSAAAYAYVAEGDPAAGGVHGDPYGPPDPRDSLPHVPHSVVVGPRTAHAEVARPHVPWSQTVVYEAHVRGLTKALPGLPPELRGTYAGLAHPVTVEHLRALGVTTLELLPVHASVTEPHLVAKGLENYWGYSTLGFFAPHAAYATRAAREAGAGAVVDEVRGMVHLLHEAGIEVLLDVVHNHTAEAGDDGPHLSLRGLENATYYLHDGASPARYADVTGTGNTLDFRQPRVVQLTLDSLRYWAQEIGVDGFRFDLAVTLGRGPAGFDPHHPFLVALQCDPVLNGLKLVAEPWDVGPGGWQTGGFPAPMAEWNDRFRNAARQFWLADPREAAHGRGTRGVRELATRLAGSADLFGHSEPPLVRGPVASINMVTAHDGFTLADLVAFDHKHNEANGEGGRDGSDDNRSWNHGIEDHLDVPDDEPGPGGEIAPLRRRSIRNLLATLLLSAGTPMLTAGDELGRTQRGNNNAYCQDNETSWVDWDLDAWRTELLATTRHLLALRREHRALRADAFFLGLPRSSLRTAVPDLVWFGAEGDVMDQRSWNDPATRVVQMLRTGPADDAHDVLLVLNGSLDDVEVALGGIAVPDGAGTGGGAHVRPQGWTLAWDSDWEHPDDRSTVEGDGTAAPGDVVVLEPLSLQVYVSR
nr:glycogen debranching protein GlgX [Cellulomonas sp. PhB143]